MAAKGKPGDAEKDQKPARWFWDRAGNLLWNGEMLADNYPVTDESWYNFPNGLV